MAVWLVRAGSHGQHEQKFLQDNKVFVTWDGLDADIGIMKDRTELACAMEKRNPEAKPKSISNWVSQVWPFAHEMVMGDLVIVPLKDSRTIQIGEIKSDYQFDISGPNPYYHWRSVKWIGEGIPRTNFAPDLLFTFGAFMTICRVKRNNAEQRIATMKKNRWQPEFMSSLVGISLDSTATAEDGFETDIEELARDRIAAYIGSKFKGHDFTRLVEAVLRAEGYTTYRSPDGADGGVDILAGSGPLGFQSPRLCVEVKSGDATIDRPSVDKLLGAVSKFGADEGLFVSWSGYKGSVQKELATSFFKVRLWGQSEVMEKIFEVYDQLDSDIKAELPMSKIWTLVIDDED